jgi:hypothetical protein
MTVKLVQFTQEQVRDIAQISSGDLRQWRKSVPYLAERPGKKARFAFSDVVALAITRELTGSLGARISEISLGIDTLFRLLSQVRPTDLGGLIAIIESRSAELLSAHELSQRKFTAAYFIAPCDPLIAEIGSHMIPLAAASNQINLPFPPHSLRSH